MNYSADDICEILSFQTFKPGTHLWTLGQRAGIGGKHIAYYVCELRPDTQEVIVVRPNKEFS